MGELLGFPAVASGFMVVLGIGEEVGGLMGRMLELSVP